MGLTEQQLIEVMSHTLVYGTGFIKIANTPQGIEWSVVEPRDYRYIEPIEAEEVGHDTARVRRKRPLDE